MGRASSAATNTRINNRRKKATGSLNQCTMRIEGTCPPKEIPTHNTHSGIVPISLRGELSVLVVSKDPFPGVFGIDLMGLGTGNRDSRRATKTLAKQITDELQQRDRSIDNKRKKKHTQQTAASGSSGGGNVKKN